MNLLASFQAAARLALGHASSNRLRLLDGIPAAGSCRLPAAVSVTFIFVRILPGLRQSGGDCLDRFVGRPPVHHHAYIIALMSLTLVYAVEQFVQADETRTSSTPTPEGFEGAAATAQLSSLK